MYLSRVKVDDENCRKVRELNSLDAFHNWVEGCFPEEFEVQERKRKLWRLDTLQGERYLLIVSEKMPNIEGMELYGMPGSVTIKEYDSFLNHLKENQKMRFRVTLNPVMAKANRTEGKRGRIFPHVTVEQQMKFLFDRAIKNGFSLSPDEFTIVERGYGILQKNRNVENRRPIRLSKAVYEGILTITEAARFRQILVEGFGKKKAYGFGMMTVIPVQS